MHADPNIFNDQSPWWVGALNDSNGAHGEHADRVADTDPPISPGLEWLKDYVLGRAALHEAGDGGLINFRQFRELNPVVRIEGGSETRIDKSESDVGFPYTLTHGHAHGVTLTAIAVEVKEEDALRAAALPDGTIGIAVADGATESLYSAIVARKGVESTIEALQRGAPFDVKLFETVSDEVNKLNLLADAQSRVESTNVTWYDHGALKGVLQSEVLGASTLTALRYNPVTGELWLKILEDSPVVIIRDGTYVIHPSTASHRKSTIRDANALVYSTARHFAYDQSGETNEKEQLVEGDVVVACTDGVPPSVFGLIAAALKRASAEGVIADRSSLVIDMIKAYLRQNGAKDDATAIAFEHKSSNATKQAGGAWWAQPQPALQS